MPEPLDWLFGLEQFGIKFGLGNITAIVEALGRPDRAFRSIHIAGTNGKGSVAAMVDTSLRAAGHRVGRYTSPHLVDLAERFTIQGAPIDRAALQSAVAEVRASVEGLQSAGALEVHPTFFEVTTAVAFELFRRAAVDVAVCEVGLGGRLDATNVLTPIVSAITSIGFDHELYLGRSLAAIAREKGGIIKPGVPVVVGRMEESAAAAITRIAFERAAPIVPAGLGDYAGVARSLRGRHQADNAAVAVSVLETANRYGLQVPHDAIVRGLADTVWPGRLDVRRLDNGREALLDAAHNAAGAAALAEFLETSLFRGAPLVFGTMRDKDVDAMLQAVGPVVGNLILTRPSNARAAEPAELRARAQALLPFVPAAIIDSPVDALAAAWALSRRIVVAGSIFLLGDVMKASGWS